MTTEERTVSIELFEKLRGIVLVTVLREAELSTSIISAFLSSATSNLLGATASYGQKGVLSALLLSTETRCLRVLFSTQASAKQKAYKKPRAASNGRRLLQDEILRNRQYRKLAFDAERLACGLYFDHELRIASLVDAECLGGEEASRGSVDRLVAVLEGGRQKVKKALVVKVFDKRLRDINDREFSVQRAWATLMAGTGSSPASRIQVIPSIHMDRMDDMVLMALAKCVRDADQLAALKPLKVKNDVTTKFSTKEGKLDVTLQRYTTRLRRNDRQHIVVESSIKGRKSVRSKGTVSEVSGKNATLKLPMSTKDAALATIRRVYTLGPENATSAELARTTAILGALQGVNTFLIHPLARRIYLGHGFSLADAPTDLELVIRYDGPLNSAQKKAVEHILSPRPENAIIVVQGPPGTGKTTVVAASVTSMASMPPFLDRNGVWLVAHSNVAVKKMAEKLVDVGFHDFKLLVSHEFHFQWHEHLYGDVLNSNLIPSNEFPKQKHDTERRLAGSKVILCSLSMLSSSRMITSGFTEFVPVSMVMVDEASQIEIGDYIPLLNLHGHVLKKMVLIGDDKQLAPFGQEDLGTLRSVFEMANIRKDAIFLDTQYRMPTPIGDFISRRMYGGRLKSQHQIQDSSSCRFVDVAQGKETKAGHSFKNVEEANYAVRIAKRFHAQRKAYRIITPYDGQRCYIENLLKHQGIPWEDRCFNVDSFQGNEAEHIIISVVRTEKVGFLSNRRRSNVMLSRCKCSMTICTNRAFVSREAQSTLLGEMCADWGSEAWLSTHDILEGRF